MCLNESGGFPHIPSSFICNQGDDVPICITVEGFLSIPIVNQIITPLKQREARKESDTIQRLNNNGLKGFVASVEAWSPGLQTKEILGAQRCLLEASKIRAVSGWLSVGVPLFSSVWG